LKIQKGSVMSPEMFEFCQWPKMEGPIGLHPVHGQCIKCKIDGVPVSNVTEAEGLVAQQRRGMTTPGILEREADHGGLEDCEVVQKGTGTVAMSSRAGDLVWEQGLIWSQRNDKKSSWRTWLQYKVIADTMDRTVGKSVHEGLGDGRAGRASRDRDGVRRH